MPSIAQHYYPLDYATMPNMLVFGAYEEENNSSKKNYQSIIGLYTSDTVVYDENQSYETPFMLDFLANIAGGYRRLQYLAKAPGFIGSAARGLQGLSDKLTGLDTEGIQNPAVKSFIEGKAAINPLVAVIYSHPNLRTFQYDFTFAPKSAHEAAEVEKIINKFRYHAAPDIQEGSAGLLFKIPEKWSVEHYCNTGQNGFKLNWRIPQIRSCVLEAVNVNYTPQGQFITYSDDYPVAVTLRLAFKETQFITKKDIKDQEDKVTPGGSIVANVGDISRRR